MAVAALQESERIADVDGFDDNEPVAVAVDTRLAPGTRVEVRRRFDAKWARGFEVLEHSGGLYHLRRLSDGARLPVGFVDDDVREHATDTWWI